MPLTGLFGGVVESWCEVMAENAAFQTWTGAADEDEAAEHVFRFLAPNSEFERPACIISMEGGSLDSVGMSTGVDFAPYPRGGKIRIQFEGDDVAIAGDHEAAAVTFLNSIQAIIGELVENAGQSGYVLFTKVVLRETLMPGLVPREKGQGENYFYQTWEFSL